MPALRPWLPQRLLRPVPAASLNKRTALPGPEALPSTVITAPLGGGGRRAVLYLATPCTSFTPGISSAKKGRILEAQVRRQPRSSDMLYYIALFLLVLWLAAWLGLKIVSGFIHLLAILALVAFVMALLKKKQA